MVYRFICLLAIVYRRLLHTTSLGSIVHLPLSTSRHTHYSPLFYFTTQNQCCWFPFSTRRSPWHFSIPMSYTVYTCDEGGAKSPLPVNDVLTPQSRTTVYVLLLISFHFIFLLMYSLDTYVYNYGMAGLGDDDNWRRTRGRKGTNDETLFRHLCPRLKMHLEPQVCLFLFVVSLF